LGNVRETPFSRIWQQSDDTILRGLRIRPRPVGGRCALCRFLDLCGGGFRVRACQKFGDPWREDPGCYLTDEEISSDSAWLKKPIYLGSGPGSGPNHCSGLSKSWRLCEAPAVN
jgi:radical SAM protein with 4Fe4S-binding SPASM domain